MFELVCPHFDVEKWEREGSKRTVDESSEFFDAYDGICRLIKYENGALHCRCGEIFLRKEAKKVPVRR